MNTQILPRGVTCITVSIITVYIKEKRTPLPACLPLRALRADLHLSDSSCCIVQQTRSSTDFGADAIFYNYSKHQLNNGNEILFPP